MARTGCLAGSNLNGYGHLVGLFNVVASLLVWLTAVSVAVAAPPRLLLLGDSLTAGYGLPIEDAFPTQLENALRAKGLALEVINAGVSGDTTAGALDRLEWVLADKPTHALVVLGGNDALRGLDPADMRDKLGQIVAGLRQAGVQVLLAGMYAPRNLGREYGDRFNAIYPELAAKHDVPLYPFFLEGVALDPKLNQEDGMHPNAKGVAIVVDGILPHLTALIDGLPETTGQ